MPAISEKQARELFGSSDEVRVRMNALRRSASVFSSRSPRLIEMYPERWVAVRDGAVVADAVTLPELLESVDKLGLPRNEILVRFIEENQRALIL
ncbi:MAG: DUF5678 domain-containing protein [Chloroflexi bacterium]|nr:DUF5678 domain-containing protein [Chloroflexota bacterium]